MDINKEIGALIEYYAGQGAPGDQQMLIALLKEAQEAEGGVLSNFTIDRIINAYGLKKPILTALIRRIPALRYEDVPHNLEVCGTCKCSADIRKYLEDVLGARSGAACKAGGFMYRTVNCMKNCKNGPSMKWDGVLYSHTTVDMIRELIGKN